MIKKVNIREEDWDNLIILDACRYDYFSKLHGDYLRGELKKVISSGSSTVEWCKKSFQERYNDVVYISANPYVNSKVKVKGFDAKNHFYRVIDVWNWGWNKKLGTVHPKKVNEAVGIFKDDYPDKRFIIHYLRPHAPYLRYTLHAGGFPRPRIDRSQVLTDTQNHSKRLDEAMAKVLEILTIFLRRSGFLRGNPSWRIRELLNLPPASPMDAVRRSVGKNGLRRAYMENLRCVLEYVARLVEDISGVVIITADHGEFLGKEGGILILLGALIHF